MSICEIPDDFYLTIRRNTVQALMNRGYDLPNATAMAQAQMDNSFVRIGDTLQRDVQSDHDRKREEMGMTDEKLNAWEHPRQGSRLTGR